ncbi:glycoside hydrolase family 105 protein [Sphingobacterium sp. Ag1]|uniref:glycoside hydrolase family 88/105 protein n=1 Tax=Sphingobacterium sp. Ag1 TaxID=1643451 RepID=UPI000A07C1C6|nr:glycoside hydrolase family 88 protein [Sphingobacterium sp. Ag1]
MNKCSLLFTLLFSCAVFSGSKAQEVRMDSTFSLLKKVADWQWHELETVGWKNHRKDWTSGAMYTGMFAWAQYANNVIYYDKLKEVGEMNKWQIGKYRHFADDYCVGQLYTQLYEIFRDERYIQDFRSLADTLVSIPHNESLAWKNNIYTREWAWCDALFMGPPGLGYLTEATGNPNYLNKSIALWWKSTAFLYDKDERLFYRDSRYFNKREKNGAKVFWSRGNGWVIAGLARLISATPKHHPAYEQLKRLFIEMADKLAAIQYKDGSWHASLLDPESFPMKETSGTGFIGYALTWGINEGLLSFPKYQPVVTKAWDAMRSSVHSDGKLGYVQPQGAAPDQVSYDGTDVYGVGAFLLFGTEMLKMLAQFDNNGTTHVVYNPTPKTVTRQVEINLRKEKGTKIRLNEYGVQDLFTGEKIKYSTTESSRNIVFKFDTELAPGSKRYFALKPKR